ncbi:MAG TPA: bifunctional diaminohydroxyphosphoribosylaminopyrimidine deaminase/5-amino-6-(5-phosphoribosylamino)uracil reductase RibD [Candidatus Binatia bacterium]|jgi:diaminohydroxyphosphoribosylaminopyrimidine deaminase/5-amino-6-(5-phosphoribosylamino)uracil reductase
MAQSKAADRDEADKRYMRMALGLALQGAGRTSPNPLVGAVLVRGGKIVGTGYHRRAGGDHAEIVALKRAGKKARGATLYINLEPCSHYGRTPPCTLSVIQSGVKTVVAGMADPNPLVSGLGIRALRKAGIQVRLGVLGEESRRLNEAFTKYITRRVPFVIVKLAASLDGKIAAATGHSRWITGPEARRRVHQMRNHVDAVLVGVGTIVADNPQLTCRIPGGRNPIRIVLDSALRIPLSARVLRERGKTIVAAGTRVPIRKVRAIEKLGAEVWRLPTRDGGVPFASVLRAMGKREMVSVMVEGGAETAGRALSEKVVDKVCFFYAPKIIGGDGLDMIAPIGVKWMSRSLRIDNLAVEKVGQDLLVTGYLD